MSKPYRIENVNPVNYRGEWYSIDAELQWNGQKRYMIGTGEDMPQAAISLFNGSFPGYKMGYDGAFIQVSGGNGSRKAVFIPVHNIKDAKEALEQICDAMVIVNREGKME